MASKTTNPGHEHPHAAVPVRVSKESGFAGPGLDVPAAQSRPSRPAGSERERPLNRPICDEDLSLIGPQLGEHKKDLAVTAITPDDDHSNSHRAEAPPKVL